MISNEDLSVIRAKIERDLKRVLHQASQRLPRDFCLSLLADMEWLADELRRTKSLLRRRGAALAEQA